MWGPHIFTEQRLIWFKSGRDTLHNNLIIRDIAYRVLNEHIDVRK